MKSLEDLLNPDSTEEDDDEEESPKPIKTKVTKIKAGKDLLQLFNTTEAEPQDGEMDTDKTPELDAEAPLEYLSKVEELAISQTLAEERLAELNEEVEDQLDNAYQAAVNYLEAVAATGLVEEEYQTVVSELGISEERVEAELGKVSEMPPTEAIKKPAENIAKETAGIVYYLMSRRKARLKNESSAPEVEKDLTKEVGDLRSVIATRESQVRQIATAKEYPASISGLNSDEFIKKLALKSEQGAQKPKEVMEAVQAEFKAQTIKRDELLAIASSIEIEGTKLSAIYENNLLGEMGLRRVVAEYLRGGNVKKVLRQEMIEREIDFERDPVLRDHGSGSPVTHQPTTIDNLLEKSGINWNEERQAPIKPKPKPKPKLNLPKLDKPKPKPLDTLFITVILALLITLIAVVVYR